MALKRFHNSVTCPYCGNIKGGPGSGCHGGNCGRKPGSGSGGGGASSSSSDDSLPAGVQNFVDNLESKDDPPGFKDLSALNKEGEVYYEVVDKIDRNFRDSDFSEEELSAFDSMTTKKDYELYRGDSRYSVSQNKVGDVLDFEKKPTFTSRKQSHSENVFSKDGSIIVFNPGVSSLRRNWDKAEESELVRGKFKVVKISGKNIHVEKIKEI